MDPRRRRRNLQVVEIQLRHLRDGHLIRPTLDRGHAAPKVRMSGHDSQHQVTLGGPCR